MTPHHTLILGRAAGTLSSWVNLGGECWQRSDPDSVLCSYISRQIKPGLPRGLQDEDEEPPHTHTHTRHHTVAQTALSWQRLLVGRSSLVTILMSQSALFSLGQLCAVWTFQSHCSTAKKRKKNSTRRHFKWVM